ncbi:hypothetical protein TCAL_03108 [Tigriopus californicus]|uniref:Rho guanine nucleotide exchange factor 7 n=1 Tax=Tigriopus californicus TaxID=6832 RepID=A0A553NNR6_TIGCA|nr:hypothetical protein TCAL_03108 [Tigriopus californicus]
MTNGRTLLKAVYTFKGSHNDELNFKKGDVITLTQKVDGGWWEGTLNGKTGWFPANYVQEIHEDEAPSSKLLPGDMTATLVNYRQQVIKDLMDKESEFVHDLDTLHQKYLTPLGKSELVTDNEFRQLVGNLEELIDVHKSMNLAIEETSRLDPRDQKLGKIFLQHGSNVKAAHRTYWQSHPRAVCILEKYREKLDKFMEAYGASQPGLMVLTTALSKPFRHLEKYPGVAQEIEQHFEDDHPDRGDTQRSIGFYKSVALEVLTGTIRDWEGESIHNLGDIVHMGSVAVGKEHKDRYFVLFPEHLLLLSVSARMSAFIYQGKLPLSGIAVNRLEDTETIKNAFEITGAMIDRIFVVCQSKPDSQFWVELLQSQIKHARKSSSSMQSYPTPPPHVSPIPSSPPYSLLTQWIRQAIASKHLTIAQIHELSSRNTKRKHVERFIQQNHCPRVQTRGNKVECIVSCRPGRDQGYPNELNPFLRQSTASSISEIFLAVNDYNSVGDSDSGGSSIFETQPNSGGSTPVKQLDLTKANWSRLGQLPNDEEQIQRRSMMTTPSTRLVPPSSLRQIHSDCAMRRITYTISSREESDSVNSFKWIDKTPSEQSLNIPFCPPILVDYDEFGNLADRLKALKRNTMTRQMSVDAGRCAIEPILADRPKIASLESTPMPSRRNSRVSLERNLHLVEVETPMSNVKATTTVDLNRISMASSVTPNLEKSSNTSSDSGLGDICKRFSGKSRSNPYLFPDETRHPALAMLTVKELSNESTEHSFEQVSEEERYEHFSSGGNDILWRLRRVPLQKKRSLELLNHTYANIAFIDSDSNGSMSVDSDQGVVPPPNKFETRHKKPVKQSRMVFKNCLYAHWWMKVELPSLSEESFDNSSYESNGPFETWV